MNRILLSKCPQCGAELIPAFAGMIWSEHRSDHSIRNVWSCEACGYQSEHTVYFLFADPSWVLFRSNLAMSGDRSRSHKQT